LSATDLEKLGLFENICCEDVQSLRKTNTFLSIAGMYVEL
jgi:hypothetical protein